MDKLKKNLNIQPQQKGIVENVSEATTLSYKSRIIGFIVCFVLGTLCSVAGSCCLLIPGSGLMIFAILFSVGNLISVASTCFLKGPVKQIKHMFDEKRWIASILVLVFLVLTLMAALWWELYGLTIIFCVCQYLALLWYSLSCIPLAHAAIKKVFDSYFEK